MKSKKRLKFMRSENAFPFFSDYFPWQRWKAFPRHWLAIPVNDTRDCWHQENGTSSFVCHHSHKSRRQNVSGQLQSWTFDKATAYKLDWIVFAHSGCLLKIGSLKQCCKTVFVNVIWNTLKGRVRFYSKAFWKKYLTNHHQIAWTMICFYFEVLFC